MHRIYRPSTALAQLTATETETIYRIVPARTTPPAGKDSTLQNNNIENSVQDWEKSLPPRLRPYIPSAPLTKLQVKEIQSMRSHDSHSNTVSQLATKFNTSKLNIMQVSQCSQPRRDMLRVEENRRWEALGISQKVRRIDRTCRKDLW